MEGNHRVEALQQLLQEEDWENKLLEVNVAVFKEITTKERACIEMAYSFSINQTKSTFVSHTFLHNQILILPIS